MRYANDFENEEHEKRRDFDEKAGDAFEGLMARIDAALGGTAEAEREEEEGGGPEPREEPPVRKEDLPEPPDPAKIEEEGGDAEPSGGYGPSAAGGDLPSYEADIAMMRSELVHIETVVLPHYEMLIAGAEQAGNGPLTIQALKAGLEAARTAHGVSEDGIAAVEASSAAVKAAYDEAGEEAAVEPAYFNADG